MLRPLCPLRHHNAYRSYATVVTSPLRAHPPPPPPGLSDPTPPRPSLSVLDTTVLTHLSRVATLSSLTGIKTLAEEYTDRSEHVLNVSLPYESRPNATRRVNASVSSGSGVVMVAHCVLDEAVQEHKVTVSSGFALNARSAREGESLIVSCAHTLNEIRHSRLLSSASGKLKSGSFVLCPSPTSGLSIYPITSIQSSRPNSDLILFSSPIPSPHTLPLSPYPAHAGTRILTHFIHDAPASETAGSSTSPFLPGIHAAWTPAFIAGYRDSAGREANPGTYDMLSHLLFTPVPTPGSSGGPIVDEESGAIVGVVLGSRTDFGSEERGFGVPSEAIFEMFSLPGLEGKR